MPCSACFSEFGVFRKEVTCQTCGFSFCPKCCSKRSLVAKTGDTSKRQLCFKCFNNISDNQENKSPHSPPLAYKKRLEKLKNRSLSVGSSSLENQKDREIVDRLQRLKRDRVKEIVPSQVDLEERLAKLKGIDPSKYTAPPIQVFRPDRRSSIEQTTDLMKQIQEEVDLDKKRVKPEDEIAARLARLKGEPVPVKPMEEDVSCTNELLNSPQTSEMDIDKENQDLAKEQEMAESEVMNEIQNLHRDPEMKQVLEKPSTVKEKEHSSGSDIDEDAEADELIEKLLATDLDSVEIEDPNALNEPNMQSTSSDKTPEEAPIEEFPWCVLCNENAVIRCFACDGDLYCMSCFKECHDNFDIKDHKTCPFICPKM